MRAGTAADTSTVAVPFVDLGRQHAPLAAELRATFDRLLGSSAFTLGEEVRSFEAEFADFCGVAHCVGVASGTAALTIMLHATGIKPGDEVIIPAHTFIATAIAVIHAGATPVCADVDRETGLLDPSAAAHLVGPRTAAIMPVHLYGQMCSMEPLLDLAARHGLAVLEDAAQAHGARCRGAHAGTLGRAGAFSFYPSKNLGALGDAGAICTNDSELAEAARRWRDLGRLSGSGHAVAGYNERLDGLQAALLRVKLPHLDTWNAARRTVASGYREQLAGVVEVFDERPDPSSVYHVFPIRVDDRAGLRSELAANRIGTGVHYPLALPDQPALPMLHGADAPRARDWAARELSLPIFPGMRPDEVDSVARVVRAGSAI